MVFSYRLLAARHGLLILDKGNKTTWSSLSNGLPSVTLSDGDEYTQRHGSG